MNIGFDAKRYFHNKSGLGNYGRDLVDSLIHNFPTDQFFLFDKSTQELSTSNKHIVSHSTKSLLWREHGIIKDIKQLDINVYHGLSNELPIGKWPQNIKRVVTIHDVIFKTHPEKYSYIDRNIYDIKTKHALQNADSIIATSEFTLKQMADFFMFDKKKVQIAYQTCADQFWIKQTQNNLDNFKLKYQLTKPFLLYVSSFNQRKNHKFLIQAFKKLNRNDIQLVLVGQKGDAFIETLKLVKQLDLSEKVLIFPNFNQLELPLLYQSAQAFVYPSLTEGFGIPLLEAMASGLPILGSDLMVFREIASPEVHFFELNNESDLINKLNLLLEQTTIDYSKHILKFNKNEIANQVMKIYKS